MDYTVQKPNLGLVETLAALAGHHGKRYCYPSQQKIIKLYRMTSSRRMSRPTLNRHLRALEVQGYITRTRRHRRGADGGLELHSTLYQFTRRALAMLQSNGRRVAHWLATMAAPVQNLFASSRSRCLSPETIFLPQKQAYRGGRCADPPPKR